MSNIFKNILGLSLPEDLAIDWATGNIYFTDGEESFIGVCSKLGKECTALVNDNVAKPRGIALLVTKGYLLLCLIFSGPVDF